MMQKVLLTAQPFCCKTKLRSALLSNQSCSFVIYRSFQNYAAVVAGSGPSGLAVVGNLLDKDINGKILWADPDFKAGKLERSWRNVPSNTKVNLFIAYAEALEAFKKVVNSTPSPNAISALREMDQDKGCQISYAADMCDMLTQGICQTEDKVEQSLRQVSAADWDDNSSSWTVQLRPTEGSSINTVPANRLVLCTGAFPTEVPIPTSNLSLENLTLETVFNPTELSRALPADACVAVIGSSHSAVLVLLNLLNLQQDSHPQLRVRWFSRSPLKYAVYKKDYILYDNTGLKGVAADFAREQLEDDKLRTSAAGRMIQKVDCGPVNDERSQYARHLPQCTHIVYAAGFTPAPLPALSRNGRRWREGELQCDHKSGGFTDGEGRLVKGLFGAGIAFPERVTDPEGNVEMNVGVLKFMKYLKRVTGEWIVQQDGPNGVSRSA